MNLDELANYRELMLKAAEDHEKRTKTPLTVLAWRLTKRANFFKNIRDGKGCTVDTLVHVLRWFKQNKYQK